MIDEPSVLDYLKSKIFPRRYEKISIPKEGEVFPVESDLVTEPECTEIKKESAAESLPAKPKKKRERRPIPWKIAGTLFMALLAQFLLEPPRRDAMPAVLIYAWAALLLVVAMIKNELRLAEPESGVALIMPQLKRTSFLIGLPLMLFAFLLFGGNRFTVLNLALWVSMFFFMLRALWEKENATGVRYWPRLRSFFQNVTQQIRFEPWDLLLAGIALIAVYFRFVQLAQVPGEMFSDHAEKLMDVMDVLNGQHSIFFPRNTGREAVQMYLTAAVSQLFGTGLSFLSLKIGTALAGLFTLPYIYLLGKEIGNKWVGLAAVALAAIAYWPNVISRVALRFALYPLFTAPTLYYLIRGLKRSRWNDFLLAGLALGLGMHGYSPMRIVPLVILAAFGLYLLHAQSKGQRKEALMGLLVLAFVPFLVFMPLLRYMLEDPQMFGYRAFSRMGTTERTFPGSPWVIFFQNLWKAWIMPFWDNGGIWVHSIPTRPALGVVSGAFYFLGLVMILVRYVKKRNWLDLFLIVSVPLLMMPSILSLAFPEENPSLNRTGGALIIVFLIAGLGAEGIFAALVEKSRSWFGKGLTVLLALGLFVGAASQNYDLVLHQFADQFMRGAWNSSEMGEVIRGFADSVGDRDSTYVVPYPYWVDTRLVGINAGYPEKDYALWPEEIQSTLSNPEAKLFIVKEEDHQTLDLLHEIYPEGWFSKYENPLPGKNFWMFFVPPEDVTYPEPEIAE
ncbi:MAG: glycosyltransferase family 39 protein [Anaerolineaceae bacterium]|nr:glycosyltransferase family 39 protein [Anaerolineaceae bacterium]